MEIIVFRLLWGAVLLSFTVGCTASRRMNKRRAQAGKAYFVSKGVSASRLDTAGKGEQEPMAPNTKDGKDNPEGRVMNRRAELKVR